MLTLKMMFILSGITAFIGTVSSQSTSGFEGLCSTEDKQEIAALRKQVRLLTHTSHLEEYLQNINATLHLTMDKLQQENKDAEQQVNVAPAKCTFHATPYTAPIYGGMVDGRSVTIAGIPYSNASRVTIDLTSTEFSDIIPFHFDVRFAAGAVVRNARLNGGWGTEERNQSSFPFTRNESFNMVIENVGDGFQVWVNEQRYVYFMHRYRDFANIDQIYVLARSFNYRTSHTKSVKHKSPGLKPGYTR